MHELLRFTFTSGVTRCVLAFAALGCVVSVRAHPEIEDALNRLNAAIAITPADADLYVQRGELYARHEEWLNAEANYLRAAEIAPQHARLAYLRAALELATGRAEEARGRLDALLAQHAADADALVLRARTHTTLKSSSAAVQDFTAAIAMIPTPRPELYLDRAALLAPAEAIRSLDEGIERIGPAITLHLRALALEETSGRFDAAVARVDRIIDVMERKESWLKRRGDLLARGGRVTDARASYLSALAVIQTLPDWLRASPDTQQLAAELMRLTTARS